MGFSASDHRTAAILISELIPPFDAETLGPWLERSGYRPRYNIGPGQDHWVVRGREGRPILTRATWGIPGPERRLVINARAETVGERPMFRAGFARGRCLVVADGFFEWDRRSSRPQPWWFRAANAPGLLFAAILREGHAAEHDDRFAVVTVPANAEVEPLHPRMPALIEPSHYAQWLFGSTADAQPLLVSPPPGTLQKTAVSRRVNSLAHDDPACIEPVELESEAEQLGLLAANKASV